MYSIKIPRANLIAKISFTIFMFTAFFGTSLPFRQSLEESGEIVESNIINVLLYPTLFLLSFIAFIPKSKEVLEIIKREKLLILIFIWAFLTISWSAYPSVSFKRWFQQINYLFIPLVFFTYCDSIKDVIKSIKPIVYLYLAISIIVVFIIPGAKDPRFGSWRGLTPHKNSLGQLALLSTIMMSIIYSNESILLKKITALLFLFIGLALLIGANSSTSLIALAVFTTGTILFSSQTKIFSKIGTGRFIGIFSFFTLIIIFYLIYTMAPELIETFNLTGKDVTTMSDRTYLWEYMFIEISKHPFLGCGFRGFWVVGSIGINTIHSAFVFMPIQAHNGYIDIWNEVGLIGLILLAGIIFNYFRVAIKQGTISLWSWFFVLPIVINITETTLFREGHKTFMFFIIAYLIVFIFDKDGKREYINS